jgi:hypothetical protein
MPGNSWHLKGWLIIILPVAMVLSALGALLGLAGGKLGLLVASLLVLISSVVIATIAGRGSMS